MIVSRGRRLAGWALAGAGAVALLGGAGALALAADRPPPVLILDLGQLPPSAPSIAAVAEAAPTVVSTPPMPKDQEDMAEETALPSPVAPPERVAKAAVSLPEPESEPEDATDIALPPPPEVPEPSPARPRPRPERFADRVVEEAEPIKKQPARDKTPDSAEASAGTAGSTAASPATKARAGGTMSPAAYAKAVLKKVHATRKKTGAGRGTAVIGFRLAADGALVSVQVLQGSGSDSLDRIALDHIRRSAPFPPAPEGAGRTFSFEFVGR